MSSLLGFPDFARVERRVLFSPFSVLFLPRLIGLLTSTNLYDGSFHLPLCLLFRVNITYGPREERMMLSGMHTVADIFCCQCGQIAGWKYVNPPIPRPRPLSIGTDRAKLCNHENTHTHIICTHTHTVTVSIKNFHSINVCTFTYRGR